MKKSISDLVVHFANWILTMDNFLENHFFWKFHVSNGYIEKGEYVNNI